MGDVGVWARDSIADIWLRRAQQADENEEER